MDVFIWSLLLLLAISLFATGFFVKQNVIVLFGGILLFLCGILLFQGLGYERLATITLNQTGNITSSTYAYTNVSWKPVGQPYTGLSFILTGVGLIGFSMVDIFYLRKTRGRASRGGDDEV